MKNIFVVGNSRSGTTLISRFLNNNDDVYISNETHYYTTDYYHGLYNEEFKSAFDKIQKYGVYRYVDQGKKNSTSSNEVDYYLNLKNNAIANKALIGGDQTPQNVHYLKFILSSFSSNNFVINMIRDPRAISASQKHKWKAMLRDKRNNYPLSEIVRSYFTYNIILTPLIWRSSVRKGVVEHENLINIKYEDFVGNPHLVGEEICRFIGLEFKINMLSIDVELSSDGSFDNTKGIKFRDSNGWKCKINFFEEKLINYICKREMEELGYCVEKRKLGVRDVVVFPFYTVYILFVTFGCFIVNRKRFNGIRGILSRLK